MSKKKHKKKKKAKKELKKWVSNVSSLPPDDFFLPAFDAKELKKIVDKYRNR